jgi:hypothetical protein
MQYLNADQIQNWMQSVSITCPTTKSTISISRGNLDNVAFVSKIEQNLVKNGWAYNNQNQLCRLGEFTVM